MVEAGVLGVVGRFDESLVAVQYELSVLFLTLNCVQAPVNDSAKQGSTLAERTEQLREACDDDVYAELLRLNSMDFELLRRARAEVRRRFERVPDRDERLSRLREDVSKLLSRAGDCTESEAASQPVPKPHHRTSPKARWTPP